MGNTTDTKIQSDLDKYVESTILRRKVDGLELKIKRYFSWKGFGIITLLGLTMGLLSSYFTQSRDFYDSPEMYFFEQSRYKNFDQKLIDRFIESKKDKRLSDAMSSYEYVFDRHYYPHYYRLDDYMMADTTAISMDSTSTDPKLQELNDIYKKLVIKRKEHDDRVKKAYLIETSICVIIFNIIYFFTVGVLTYVWKSSITKLKLEINTIGALQLKDNLDTEQEKDFFTQLVKINFKYLDQYYLQTQEQADKSFWISAIVSIVGFVMILIGIGLMYYEKNGNSGIAATSSGIISQFIAAVFFYLYNRTILKMSQYHQKLVITQNISLALKTADLLKDSKEKVLESLIDRLTADVNKYLTNTND